MGPERKFDSDEASPLISTDLARAVNSLRNGGLVAMPTETVYGLAANAADPAAVERIFATKDRPRNHPLIVHISDRPGAIEPWVERLRPEADALARAFWPGPLTMLLPASPNVGGWITGGRPTVGVRMPNHPMALAMLREADVAVAAPSANRFGKVSPTTARHVADDIGHLLDPARDVIVDGGPSRIGVESTIVDLTTSCPQLLRAGQVAPSAIAAVLDNAVSASRGPQRAPGMLAAHYAPSCAVWLADSPSHGRQLQHAAEHRGWTVTVIDRSHDPTDAAYHLYSDLRQADRNGVNITIVVQPSGDGLAAAVRDRLARAAAGGDTTFAQPPSST